MEMTEMPGVREVISALGGWPTFHDAEIHELRLESKSTSGMLLVHPSYRCGFQLFNVIDLELNGFSAQNVIASLSIDRHGDGWKFRMSPCFGLSGWIEAESWSVNLIETSPPR